MSKKIIKVIRGMNSTMYMELRNGRWWRAEQKQVRYLILAKDVEFVEGVGIPDELLSDNQSNPNNQP